MTLPGWTPRQGDPLDAVTRFCEESLPAHSIYRFLYRVRDVLFPQEMFDDLFNLAGRRSPPPGVVAVVMVLQRLEECSDQEAVERFTFDARWRYATGVGGWDEPGPASFTHAALVDMRERLRRSVWPNRVFEVALRAAREAGLIGRRRVLNSTQLYDAVAAMDTVTLIRSAVRGLLAAADGDLAAALPEAITSGDDYTGVARPAVDWDDAAACETLIDSRAKDAHALLAVLHGRKVAEPVTQAAALVATVVGQDLDVRGDGVFRIAPRRAIAGGVIAAVNPGPRHRHKTSHRALYGYMDYSPVDATVELTAATPVTDDIDDGQVPIEVFDDVVRQAHPAGTDAPPPPAIMVICSQPPVLFRPIPLGQPTATPPDPKSNGRSSI